MWGGALPLRKILWIIQSLPRSSALGRKLDPDQWGPAEYLLAAAVDALRGANWQRGDGKTPAPDPLPRPGEKSKAETRAELLRARVAAWRNQQKQSGG